MKHPADYRPPLAYGGHTWIWNGHAARCVLCLVLVPLHSLREQLWTTYGATRWCAGRIPQLTRSAA